MRGLLLCAAALANAPLGVLRMVADYARGGVAHRFREDGVFALALALCRDEQAVPAAAWKQVAPMGMRAGFSTAECLESGDVYVSGGASVSIGWARSVPFSRDFSRYEPDERTWIDLAPMPIVWADHQSVVCNGCVFVIGGREYNRAGDIIRTTMTASCHGYSIERNSWDAAPSMAVGRMGHSATAVGASIYVFGGVGRLLGPGLASGERLDTARLAWSATAQMPDAQCGHRAFAVASGSSASGADAPDCGDSPSVFVPDARPSANNRAFVECKAAPDGFARVMLAYCYAVNAGVWRAVHWNLPEMAHFSVHAVDGAIVVCGGAKADSADAWRLADAAAGRWARLAGPADAADAAAADAADAAAR